MKTINAVRAILSEIDPQHIDASRDAFLQLRDLVAAYDAIAPDWSKAPEWAQWYAASGSFAYWWERKPIWENGMWKCGLMEDTDEPVWDILAKHTGASFVHIPLGIDERECIWKRPDA